MLADDRRLSLRMIAEELKISLDSVSNIIHELLQMLRIVPGLYRTSCQTSNTGCKPLEISSTRVTRIRSSWKQSLQGMSRGPTLLIAFFDTKDLIHHEFVPSGTTVNAEFYKGVLKRLLQRIRRVRPQLYQNGQWKLLHDNSRPHIAIRVRQFLATRKVTLLEHPPYSPDLAPADFFLFPRLKGVLQGLRFSDIAQIQQRVTTVLRAIPKEAFADSFQQLYNRCQKCIVANGNYFECQ
ncbi:Histone-lysine N-methyltransferase SETMAR [Araneus ventricosus]|uniref:Histone-lysine N-methyltransferase SETMAR n=1 Tax=Araneus ventricosus TaxID=182803 RepID=A0A4Y2C6K1_ARAVE|nr:Histone-lysine N-methyltransferase SETMAR [Araneus ventricosus]